MPFPRDSVFVPKPVLSLEPKLIELQVDLIRVCTAASTTYVSNMTAKERRGLRKPIYLKDELRYAVGDKCGDFLVIPKSLDKKPTELALPDPTIYGETTKRTFEYFPSS
ncbi:hypothetical protein Y032_0992g3327 [Ancylostoma ceylanicum]|uniref:Uncharacterized protein n=1 Tax=Ancylostoma ceylanicum TaxID=53326 RepID=A0A016W7A8_9BILA|nr:hypothetical protein Y032_0992g3327 [Ancylostoma ceylanicum]